jgi:IS1 family transposase
MNQLSTERRAAVVRALVEGNSIRATARLTGTSMNTVLKLLVDLGELCAMYQDKVLRNLPCKQIQADEIWSFAGAKESQVRAGAKGAGDVWTWTAMDADTKLMVSWLVGRRDAKAARAFMLDLQARISTPIVQLTTDGFHGYLDAVSEAFGWRRVDYAMLVKAYGKVLESARRYSPPVCVGATKVRVIGSPDIDKVSTSFVERSNLTMRMGMRRFTRLTNGFSRKVENHRHAVALHFMHYNFCRPHTTLTKAHPSRYPTTPAMAAGLTDHVWTVEEVCGLLDPSRLLQ